jgi:hypothetical protein
MPMKLLNRVGISCLLALATASLYAQEKKITRDQLPAAVEKAVAAEESKGATVKGFSTEIEKGQKLYEAELTESGHGKDVSMDKQGNVVEVEEEVSLDSLPGEVKDGLTKAAGKGSITKVESLTKGSKLVAYEAVVKNGSKRSEVQVGPDGKKLAHKQ